MTGWGIDFKKEVSDRFGKNYNRSIFRQQNVYEVSKLLISISDSKMI